jgi:F-type H+-transporting ATPase subunit gamma
MATLREVKKRIRSVISTKRITKAMEMVAAAKLRRAQQRVEQARPYGEKLDLMLSNLAAASSEDISHPFFEERDIKRKTLVVITSDRGLCGSYNANVIRRGEQWLNKNSEYDLEIVTVGKKCNDYFKNRRWPILNFFGDWNGTLDYEKARSIVKLLTDRFLKSETDEIAIIYTQFLSMVKYRVNSDRYLPIARPEIDEDASYQVDYIFEPDPEAIYNSLLPNYATSKMITAIADAIASEHGSRMMAMSSATTNAEEMVDNLTLDYNKARQAQITKELLEVVSGAEALRG